MRLQAIYHTLTETFVSFELTAYGCNDQCASPSILDIILEADLVIRDLVPYVANTVANYRNPLMAKPSAPSGGPDV